MDLHKGYNHTVQYYETDKMGITHHSNYIRWMEEARVDFLKQIGWDYDKLEEIGVISPVTEVSCKYKSCVCVAHSEHCFVDTDGRPINLKKKYPEFYEAIISRKQQLPL